MGELYNMKIVVGSRGSKLALTQTMWVLNKIKEKNKDIEFEIKIIKTKGDKILNKPLDKIGSKGLFVKEIENELLNKKIDMAVHSMKDMETDMPKDLKFSHVPIREDYRDTLIVNKKYKSLDDLPVGAKIGTGSKRRIYQILKYREDLNIVPIRGNIETRISKINNEGLHGVILAAAGIKRLQLENNQNYNIIYLSKDIMLPAPAQGILALQIRKDREDLHNIIQCIEDKNSYIQAIAERSFLKGVNGGCHMPIGSYCTIKGNDIILEGLLGKEDGSVLLRKALVGTINNAEFVGRELANILLKEIKKYEG